MRKVISLLLAGAAALSTVPAHAGNAVLPQGSLFCISYDGLKSARANPSLNEEQLKSIGCLRASKNLEADVPDKYSEDSFDLLIRVNVITPTKIIRGWAENGRNYGGGSGVKF